MIENVENKIKKIRTVKNVAFILFFNKKNNFLYFINSKKKINFFSPLNNFFFLKFLCFNLKMLRGIKYLEHYKTVLKKFILLKKIKFETIHINNIKIKFIPILKNIFFFEKFFYFNNLNNIINIKKIESQPKLFTFFKKTFFISFWKVTFSLHYNFSIKNILFILSENSKKVLIILSNKKNIKPKITFSKKLNFLKLLPTILINFTKIFLKYKILFIFQNTFFKHKPDTIKFNLDFFAKKLFFEADINNTKNVKNLLNFNIFSNNFLKNKFNFFDEKSYNNIFIINNKISNICLHFTNYYPIFLTNKKTYKSFFLNYKNNYNLEFIVFTNKFVLNFLEKFFKKFIFIKFKNNFNNSIKNRYLSKIFFDYKNFQPAFWKNFLVVDFINTIWYSFLLKDLTMMSNWISVFMETLNFKTQKKFINFFINFINKYSEIFVDILKLKGFFFDIRGKVGVTGSSKKRHFFVKFGSLNKSTKNVKINFNQNLVRTYSGVLGLTYIISF